MLFYIINGCIYICKIAHASIQNWELFISSNRRFYEEWCQDLKINMGPFVLVNEYNTIDSKVGEVAEH
jgi:hypothetical protein